MFVVTRDIETRKFKLVAGQPLPPAYQGKYARDSIEARYGKGLFIEVTARRSADFEKFLASIAVKPDHDKVTQLTALCEEQVKRIEALEKENKALRSKKPAVGTDTQTN